MKKICVSIIIKTFVLTIGILLVAGLNAQNAFALGPDRETFTTDNPAPYATINAFNDPVRGDSRNFLRGMILGGTDDLLDSIEVSNSFECLILAFFENCAAEDLDAPALDTRLRVLVPEETGTRIEIKATISSSTTKPEEIWDEIVFVGGTGVEFAVSYIEGSAFMVTNAFMENGIDLPDEVVSSEGTLIGYDKLDGVIKPGKQYNGFAALKVQVTVDGEGNAGAGGGGLSSGESPGSSAERNAHEEELDTADNNAAKTQGTWPFIYWFILILLILIIFFGIVAKKNIIFSYNFIDKYVTWILNSRQ